MSYRFCYTTLLTFVLTSAILSQAGTEDVSEQSPGNTQLPSESIQQLDLSMPPQDLGHTGDVIESDITFQQINPQPDQGVTNTDDVPYANSSSNFIQIIKMKFQRVMLKSYLKVTVNFTCKSTAHLYLYMDYIDHSGESNFFTSRKHNVLCPDVKTDMFLIPMSLQYYDSTSSQNPTNYFTKYLKLQAVLTPDFHDNVVDISDEKTFPLSNPWNRPELPFHSLPWNALLHNKIAWSHIPSCQGIKDVINLVETPVALSGMADGGFVKKLSPIVWPKHVPNGLIDRYNANMRFTLSTWLFITDPCKHGVCAFISHRNSDVFLTPLILLNDKGNLHFQLHGLDGTGQAFLTGEPMPLRTWIHIVLTVEDEKAQLFVLKGPQARSYKHYVHTYSSSVAFKDTDGFWTLGGYGATQGASGLIGPTRIYRLQVVRPEQMYKRIQDIKILKYYDLGWIFRHCESVKSDVYRITGKLEEKHSVGTCPVQKWDLQTFKNSSSDNFLKCRMSEKRRYNKQPYSGNLGVTSQLSKTIKSLKDKLKSINSSSDISTIAQYLQNFAMKIMIKAPENTTYAFKLLETSGCLGNAESFFIASVLHSVGYGVPIFTRKAIQFQLMAAVMGDPLGHLSLGYKHQIGSEGVSADCHWAAGYFKVAATITRKMFENEEVKVHTHSEMIRLDEAHLFADQRGIKSDVMKWLMNRAQWGSGDAQSKMAEILFHGQHGVEANRPEAVRLFEMGAAQGDPGALYNLGVLHLRGIDVEKNESKGVELFERAAKKNYSLAYNSLGYVELVHRQNKSGAEYYWRRAAELGDREGTFHYGALVESGLNDGQGPNKALALEYFIKAADKGQKAACMKAGDAYLIGELKPINCKAAIKYYRHVAEQLPFIGVFLRDGLDSYLAGDWRKSLTNYLLAFGSGLALGSFNAAILCEEYEISSGKLLKVNCPLHFHNISGELGWSPSLLYMGDAYWYGNGLPKNYSQSAVYYTRALETDGSPRGLYNLGYIVENSYPVKGVRFVHMNKYDIIRGNLTLASQLYESCRDSTNNKNEGYYPCSLAWLRVKLKLIWNHEPHLVYASIFVLGFFAVFIWKIGDDIT